MTEKKQQDNTDLKVQIPQEDAGLGLDAAEKSLSDALGTSFFVLKFIMVILVLAFLLSGLRTVGPGEKALVLRFGKIRGVGEKRLLDSGFHLLWPYPIHELVRIPVEKKVNLSINSFWYYQSPDELIGETAKEKVSRKTRMDKTLDPIRDGYCITRSEKNDQSITGSTGSDYNIVHSKWQLTYQIDDPERFFKNVFVDTQNLPSGLNYADVIEENVTKLLEFLIEDAVVNAMVHYTIDQAVTSQDTIPKHVERLLQNKLKDIESGIKVTSVQLVVATWPRQVDNAFSASMKATQQSDTARSKARSNAQKILNETAGSTANELYDILTDKKNVTKAYQQLLWDRLAGSAQDLIAQAKAYRIEVVENAAADAKYLKNILPEYRKHPKLVIQKIYQDAIENIFDNVEETIIVPPAQGQGHKEFRFLINRDPAIKQKSLEQDSEK